MSVMPLTKRKRVSRKNKISWRKYIDIEDVNQFLEEQRSDERIGQIADKSNEELFVVDTIPGKQKFTARDHRKSVAARPIRSFLALENTSKVVDPIAKRNRVRTKEERKHFIAKSIAAAKAAKGIIPKRKLQSESDRLKFYAKLDENKKTKNVKNIADKDIWAVGDVIEQHPELHSQWVDKNVVEHTLSNTGTAITSIPKSAFHKRSQLKKINIPHPGTSYNPTLKDHQNLLENVVELEEKIIKNEEHLARVTTSMFDKMTAAQRDAFRYKEMKGDGTEDSDVSLSDADDSDSYNAINPPVVVKKKDKKTRRKAREQKEIKQKLLKAKLEKKKITDIHRLRHLKDDIGKMENELKVLRERKNVRKDEKKLQPRRIGKQVFKQQDIDFTMPEAISGNLRNIKAEGNLLVDRFKSMQQRNILAPSVDVGLRRRREIKRFDRKSHKDEEVQPNKLKNK